MSEIWIVSDTHFGHENIIKYCSRPFQSAYQMNEVMIENWNRVVKPGDHIWHLGDVYFGKNFKGEDADLLFKRLNGRKRLILGNHDNGQDKVLHRHFEKIVMWRDFKEYGLLLSHVPIHPDSIIGEKDINKRVNVHGHIHNKPSPGPQYINVSVEMTDYTPVNIEKLRVI